MNVVFDVGSYSTRVGFQYDTAPKSLFPSLASHSNEDIVVGNDAKIRGAPKQVITVPISNWDYMEKLYCHGFKQLKTDPKNHRILLNNPYCPCTKNNREKLTQLMFEKFNIPAMHLTDQAVLSLYSYGRLTGLVLHSGFYESQCYPIYEGHILSTMTRGLPVAGQYLTYSLRDILNKKGYNCDNDTANAIKEKLFYVAHDGTEENEETFTLPDGKTVTLVEEKHRIPEEMFTPFQELGVLQDQLSSTINRSDPTLRGALFSNIVLSGGNTLFPGFPQRLEKEVGNCRVIAPINRQISAWIGGTILASLPTFPATCMTIDDYNEYGPGLVHTKFF